MTDVAVAEPPPPVVVQRVVAGFEEPLVATGGTSKAEDDALGAAIADHESSSRAGMVSLEAFLASHPDSGWDLSLQADLALWHYAHGYFSDAIAAWEDAWRRARALPTENQSAQAKAVADRAVGELIRMHARLGHVDRVAELLDEVRGRPLTGPATELVAGAKDGLWTMRHEPGIAFLCGPAALLQVALAEKTQGAADLEKLRAYRSDVQGVTLAELAALADQAHLALRPAYRTDISKGVPVPSVVHWNLGHYAAIVEEKNGRYRVQDPTFGRELWLTRDAVDRESSGFFMVPKDITEGWRDVTEDEAQVVRGRGFTTADDVDATRDSDSQTKCDCGNDPSLPPVGMAGYNAHDMLVSLDVRDTPVGYTPPIGPAVQVKLHYSQREAQQPAVATFFNFGPKWVSNWLAYIVDDPLNPGQLVTNVLRDGGAYIETGYSGDTGAFTPEAPDASVLTLVSTSPVRYVRRYRDGRREVYEASDGAHVAPRRVFLTQVVDPQGNAATLHYDAQMRLRSIQDAVGRETHVDYGSAAWPLQPTRIADPFGRSAQIDYDAQGRLKKITDVAGLRSTMTYSATDPGFISALHTPYGTSRFAYGETDTDQFRDRWLAMTDAMGHTERLESQQPAALSNADPRGTPAGMDSGAFNDWLQDRNTFYWDKLDFERTGATDVNQSKIKHFFHDYFAFMTTSAALSSVKQPLEGRVWYTTPGDVDLTAGTYNEPSAIGRILDDGSSQVEFLTYNPMGNLATDTDPAGRQRQYVYEANGIDVRDVQVRQADGSMATVEHDTYYPGGQHLVHTRTDAAHQTTTFDYNPAGQVVRVVDALGHEFKYRYETTGELKEIVNPGDHTAVTFTYDAFDRVRTRTDSEGRVVTYDYDALDRPIKVSYLDGTSERYVYDRLDLHKVKDRLDRWTTYEHDEVRNLTKIVDPMSNPTTFEYYPNGLLKRMTDANGHDTLWERDLQGRVTHQRYADGTHETLNWEPYGGRLTSRRDGAGRVQAYGYTVDDRLAHIEYRGGDVHAPPVGFAYDPVWPRLDEMDDGNGRTIYKYHGVGAPGALQLAREVSPFAHADIEYGYDELGRVAERTVGGDRAEKFHYDADGRLKMHTSDLGEVSIDYLGQTVLPIRQGLNERIGAHFDYESAKDDLRLREITDFGARRFRYQTDAVGRVTHITDSRAVGRGKERHWVPGYDDDDRLTSVRTSTGQDFGYGPDAVGNISPWTTPLGQFTATYDKTNAMTSMGGTPVTRNLAGDILSDARRDYRWDGAGRLAEIRYKSRPDLKTTFRYDGFGRRTAIDESDGKESTEARYTFCGDATPCQQRDGQDEFVKRYFGEGEIDSKGRRSWYDRDLLGSVRDITSIDNGKRLASFDFDPYGNMLASRGTESVADLRYAGMLYHSTSGLYLTPNRVYDSNAMRWLSRDPLNAVTDTPGPASGTSAFGFSPRGNVGIDGVVNAYAYVDGNPLRYVDPTGENAVLGAEFGAESGFLVAGPPGALAGAILGGVGGYLIADQLGNLIFNRPKNPPDVGPPGGWLQGPRRGRQYCPDGTPQYDIDKPHQGNEQDHVHEWPGGVREEPGRPVSPWPRPASGASN
jgi:RHS repeat-associated protein